MTFRHRPEWTNRFASAIKEVKSFPTHFGTGRYQFYRPAFGTILWTTCSPPRRPKTIEVLGFRLLFSTCFYDRFLTLRELENSRVKTIWTQISDIVRQWAKRGERHRSWRRVGASNPSSKNLKQKTSAATQLRADWYRM